MKIIIKNHPSLLLSIIWFSLSFLPRFKLGSMDLNKLIDGSPSDLILIILLLLKGLVISWLFKFSSPFKKVCYSFIISVGIYALEFSAYFYVFKATEISYKVSAFVVLLVFSLLEDSFYRRIDSNALDGYFRYFSLVGIILLIIGHIDKNLFTVITTLTTFFVFLLNEDSLDKLFNTNEKRLIQKDSDNFNYQFDGVTLFQMKVILYLSIVTLLFVIVLTDVDYFGPELERIINSYFTKKAPKLVKGMVRFSVSLILVPTEIYIFKMFRPSIAKALSKPTRFF